MNKKLLTIIGLSLLTKFSFGTVQNTTINKTVNAANPEYKLDITGEGTIDFTFNFFAASGAISVTATVGTESRFTLATSALGGGSYNPVKVKNNQLFTNQTTWKSNSIYMHSASLNYSGFAGTGNQYIVGKMNYNGDTTMFYYWILVNINATGTQLNIIKSSFEKDPEELILTGNEGESNGGTFISNKFVENSFSVFPQPASAQIEIQTNETIESYKIFNLNGQLINEQSYFKNNIINVANLPKGIYLLQLLNNNNFTLTKKIIIE